MHMLFPICINTNEIRSAGGLFHLMRKTLQNKSIWKCAIRKFFCIFLLLNIVAQFSRLVSLLSSRPCGASCRDVREWKLLQKEYNERRRRRRAQFKYTVEERATITLLFSCFICFDRIFCAFVVAAAATTCFLWLLFNNRVETLNSHTKYILILTLIKFNHGIQRTTHKCSLAAAQSMFGYRFQPIMVLNYRCTCAHITPVSYVCSRDGSFMSAFVSFFHLLFFCWLSSSSAVVYAVT